MKRMWDEKEIIKIAEEHGSGEGGVSKTYVDEQDQKIKEEAEHYTDESVTGLVATSEMEDYVADQIAANPEAEGTATLSKLKVGETVYSVGGGSGAAAKFIDMDAGQTLTAADLVPTTIIKKNNVIYRFEDPNRERWGQYYITFIGNNIRTYNDNNTFLRLVSSKLWINPTTLEIDEDTNGGNWEIAFTLGAGLEFGTDEQYGTICIKLAQ